MIDFNWSELLREYKIRGSNHFQRARCKWMMAPKSSAGERAKQASPTIYAVEEAVSLPLKKNKAELIIRFNQS
ncbi:hypothetical protein OROHE_016237 [Orobanche hederae]